MCLQGFVDGSLFFYPLSLFCFCLFVLHMFTNPERSVHKLFRSAALFAFPHSLSLSLSVEFIVGGFTSVGTAQWWHVHQTGRCFDWSLEWLRCTEVAIWRPPPPVPRLSIPFHPMSPHSTPFHTITHNPAHPTHHVRPSQTPVRQPPAHGISQATRQGSEGGKDFTKFRWAHRHHGAKWAEQANLSECIQRVAW